MDVAVVVMLVGLWAAILLPGLIRARRYGSPATSVSRFHGSMDLLERTSVGGGRNPGQRAASSAEGSPRSPREERSRKGPSPDAGPAEGGRGRRAAPRRASRARAPSRPPGHRAAPRTAAARRRAVLVLLSGLAAITLATAPIVGPAGWGAAAVSAVLLGGYVAGLRRLAVRRRVGRRVDDVATARADRQPEAVWSEQPPAAVGAEGAPVPARSGGARARARSGRR